MSPADCGTFLATGGQLYAPDFANHAATATRSLGAYVPFTQMSQTGVTGTGTQADPFHVVTKVGVGSTGLTLTQTDTYVAGADHFNTNVVITNTATASQTAILYRAGDCYLANSDSSFGLYDSTTGAVGCQDSAGARTEEWIPRTPGSSYVETFYNTLWRDIGGQQNLPDTCDCSINEDSSAGLSWSVTIPPGQSVTVSNETAFGTRSVWTEVGPGAFPDQGVGGLVTGRVTAILADPRASGSMLIGTAGGGVWKGTSTSSGESWTPLSDHLAMSSIAIGSLARDPSNPNRIYAGTGEDGVGFPVGDGIYVSSDGGSSWQIANPPPIVRSWYGIQVGGLSADASSSTHVLAATTLGLLESSDGGINWFPLQLGHFTNVVQDPSNPARFWATQVSGGGGTGCSVSVFESTNGGTSFSSQFSLNLNTGPFDAGAGLGMGKDGSAYLTVSDCQGYLHDIRRHEGTAPGGDWHPITKPGQPIDGLFYPPPTSKAASFPGQGSFDNVVAVDPTNPCTVAFGGVHLWVTANGCDKKKQVQFTDVSMATGNLHDDFHAIAFVGAGAALVGSDGGIYAVQGLTSSPVPAPQNLNTSSLNIAQFYSGEAVDSTHLMGGTQDNGTPGMFGGAWQSCGGGDGGQSSLGDPSTPTYFEQDELLFASTGCGQSQNFIGACQVFKFTQFTYPLPCDNQNGVKDPAQFPDPPFAVGAQHLYEATTRVWESSDPPSPFAWTDTTGGHPLVRSGLSGYACGNYCPDYISSMSAETDIGHFFTASAYGAVWANPNIDGGGAWTDVTGNLPAPDPQTKPAGIPWITHIAISPATSVLQPNLGAWVTLGGNVIGGGHVWRYDGTTGVWTDMSTGLPHYPATALAVTFTSDTTGDDVFVGLSNGGVYECQNCYNRFASPGVHWQQVGSGLPGAWISDLSFSTDCRTLYAWIFGRGVWSIGSSNHAAC